jgi:hypothetical protein
MKGKNLNECIKNTINEKFVKLHNPNKNALFDTIDPFWFEKGAILFTKAKDVRGTFSVQNITIVGGKKFVAKNVSMETKNDDVKIVTNFGLEKIISDGSFQCDLKLNDLMIKTSGKFNVTMIDAGGKLLITGKLVNKKDGLKQLIVSNCDLLLVVKDMKFKITGLARDDNISELIN